MCARTLVSCAVWYSFWCGASLSVHVTVVPWSSTLTRHVQPSGRILALIIIHRPFGYPVLAAQCNASCRVNIGLLDARLMQVKLHVLPACSHFSKYYYIYYYDVIVALLILLFQSKRVSVCLFAWYARLTVSRWCCDH